MARYAHLKVFNDCYNLTKCLLVCIRKFPKVFKYTLGTEIQKNMYEIMSLIVTTNSLREKKSKEGKIFQIITLVEIVHIQIRLASDMKCFASKDIWFDIVRQTNEVLKQLEGWMNYYAEKK